MWKYIWYLNIFAAVGWSVTTYNLIKLEPDVSKKKKIKTKPFKKLLADLIWNTIQLNALNVPTAISMQLFKQCILLHTNIIYHLQNKTACGHPFHKRYITLLHITYIYADSVTKLISFFKIVSQYLDFFICCLIQTTCI